MTKQTLLSSFFKKNKDSSIDYNVPIKLTSPEPRIESVENHRLALTKNMSMTELQKHPSPVEPLANPHSNHDQIVEINDLSLRTATTAAKSIANASSSDEDCPLSEYEKLRVRNIKRNHDRLVSLGLMANPSAPSHSGPSLKRKKRKKVLAKKSEFSMPLRRSTRGHGCTRKSQVEVANSALSVEKSRDVKSKAELMANVGENVLADKFQESALVQYSMECNVSSITSSSQHQGALTSLLPIGSRLLSPKANLALYSLDIYSNNQDFPLQWIVGAGKSGIVSIWNCSDKPTENGIDPILTWKAHGGRWISDACFVPRCGGCNYTKSDESSDQRPSILVTAANDGTVCLWDLRSTSSSTGVPKNLATTGKKLHTGGIFSMHVDTKGSNYNDIYICTGSKDKTLAVTPLESISSGALCSPIFVSHHHNSKVGCVQLQGNGSALIGSSSDDGTVAVHDFRVNKIVADIDFAHDKPHSFVWNPRNSVSFITAGHDNVIHGWDLRNLKNPLQSFIGHVPLSTKRCKRIHRPSFFTTNDSINGRQFEYVLSGSENSGCISIFDCNTEGTFTKDAHVSVYSRGNLPMDCGDAGCLAVRGSSVAVAVDGGDVLLLQPKPNKD